MKYPFNHLSLFVLLIGVTLSACQDQCKETFTYIEYTPQYMSISEMRASFDVLPPRTISESGKIYLYGTTLFVTEPDSGIHVIDNTDPRNPVRKNFIQLPGVHDLTVKDDHLYADSYIDLVVLDITDQEAITLIQRLEDVFYNQYDYLVDWNGTSASNTSDQFVTHFEETDRVQANELDCQDARNSFFMNDAVFFREFDVLASNLGNSGGSGVSGSMARMNIVGNYLYGIDNWQLHVFDISSLSSPSQLNTVDVGWNIETLFPYKDNLFIGAADGMYIFDNSTPEAPLYLSKFSHARACDPVVVQDTIAYVTLRDGTECDGFVNQLDVVNVADLTNPRLLYTFPMDNPHGLGVDGDNLFICEGSYGLKLFDKSDLSTIDDRLTNWIKNIHAFDVIPIDDHLMMIGEDGLYQFDYSDPENIEYLSKILTRE